MNNATSILQFQCNYGKTLVAAREAKCSAKSAEAGIFDMEALHKQVVSHRYEITFISLFGSPIVEEHWFIQIHLLVKILRR